MPDQYEYAYKIPEFLQGQSADEIHRRMLDSLPPGIDRSEGSIPWDFTRPAALEKAEMVEFVLNETIKLIFPQWSYGTWLDLHGEKVNCIRRAANRAAGELLVTGTPETIIPTGYQFATAADLTASVIFEVTETVKLNGTPDSKGQVTRSVPIRALDGGSMGNVARDTIKLMVKPMRGITYLTNPEPATGGTETESDADYLVRILDAMRAGSSMTGCVADYVRWGLEVPGVGQCIVEPEWADPSLPEEFHYTDSQGYQRCSGAVRLILIDSNGLPANQQILDAVYQHIMGSADDDIKRLAPIGAHLTVTAPEGLEINIVAEVLLDDGADLTAVSAQFHENLNAYWLEVGQESTGTARSGDVRWVQVGAILAKTDGVKDYSNLTINGGSENIPVTHMQYPVTGEVTLRVQTGT